MNFAIAGVGGYIAPRHLKAIYETNNKLVAALDPKDSVGLLDSYDLDLPFFTEPERFGRHLEKLRLGPDAEKLDFLTVCSPNYLHDAHCRMGLRVGANVICEKPLVINPWNLDALQEIEAETGGKVNTILQLRVHPALIALREKIRNAPQDHQHEVKLTYITARGTWYKYSWKGDPNKSGGVSVNIGIHFFDLLIWLFGEVGESRVYLNEEQRMSGYLEMERAQVKWYLSLDWKDLPFAPEPGKRTTYRSITVDGEEVEFTQGFKDLHTLVYEHTIAGNGFGIEDVRPCTELTYQIRTADVLPCDDRTHDMVKK